MWLWTLPSLKRPIRWSVCPGFFAASAISFQASRPKIEPSLIDSATRAAPWW